MRYVRLRGKWFYYRRRIPLAYQHHYQQNVIKIALKTDSPATAYQRAELLNDELERIWANIDQEPGAAQTQLDLAVQRALFSNFGPRSTQDIAEGSLAELIERVLELKDRDALKEPQAVAAVLGSGASTVTPVSKALDDYFDFEIPNKSFAKGGESSDQMRKWENPRKRAIKNFIEVCGDIETETISRDHILAFRQWWYKRIQSEGLKANSANKNFTHLRSVLSFMRDSKGLDIDIERLFARINLTEHENDRKRRPFDPGYIQNTLLDRQRLGGLNHECQMLLFAMADTGARPNELIGLDPDNGDIRLDTDIPYIHIRPNSVRQLKTPHSKRILPLVGASLFAFQQLQNGFEHYRGRPDTLSATLNKFLRTHNLITSDEHCVYSLRHSFEDRLTAVEPPEKIQAMLMGHKYERERYGDGPSLEQKKRWLDKICFTVECY